MYSASQSSLSEQISEIRSSGLYKNERVIESPQSSSIKVNGKSVLNFCANNYLGLADNAEIIAAAKEGLDAYGFGLASVRFICGTQTIHKQLEHRLSEFHKTEDTILYSSCFDANGGLFETILGEDDAVVSDALNHASIIDGIRLCKAKRFRFEHANMDDLRAKLTEAKNAKATKILISTDGVFSMDGDIARLGEICDLAEEFSAMVHVDECHATGFLGANGRGAYEHCGVMGRVDVITSTLGKALGGGSGGFTTGRKEIIELLRQRSRPYLFSNSLPPPLVCASIKCLEVIERSPHLRRQLEQNTARFREGITSLGFSIKGETHPITPVMLGDATLASRFADNLLAQGIYVIGFFFPVVPKGQARIRTQMSAAHTTKDIDRALEAFASVGRSLNVIPA
jgi:glycine C-acetyltransferase